MDDSFFERISSHDVSRALGILVYALAAFGSGVAVFACYKRWRHLWPWGVLAFLPAAAALLLWVGWGLVLARTSFHDRLYQRPGERHDLDGLAPPAERYEARERARYSPTDDILREGLPADTADTPSGPVWLPADRLDSLGNLALLGAVFAVGGLVAGMLGGLVIRHVRPTVRGGGAEA